MFWENLTSQMEIALFAESFAVFGSKQFIQCQTLRGMGWPGQVGPLDAPSEGRWALQVWIRGAMPWGGAECSWVGGVLPDRHTRLAPVCRPRRARSFAQRSLLREQSGHTPPHPKLSGSHGAGGRLGVKSRGDALPCPARITTTDTSEGRTWL